MRILCWLFGHRLDHIERVEREHNFTETLKCSRCTFQHSTTYEVPQVIYDPVNIEDFRSLYSKGQRLH